MDKLPEFRIIAGLGNPGDEYSETFHNAGFLFLDKAIGGTEFKKIKGKKFERAKRKGIVFIRPLTFMNEAGAAVKEALSYFKMKPEDLLVVQDDSDIPLGDFKISFGIGSAGHKGVQSIINMLGTAGFWRLRLGVRKRPGKAGDFVLKEMGKEDLKLFDQRLENAIEKVIEKSNP